MELDAFIDSGFLNAPLFEEMYASYRHDPSSVDLSFRSLFQKIDLLKEGGPQAGLTKDHQKLAPFPFQADLKATHVADLRVLNLIHAYRSFGHLYANTNPLDPAPVNNPEMEIALKDLPDLLKPESFGFREEELSSRFLTYGLLDEEKAPLSQIISALKETYCGKIGVEYMGFACPELESWLQNHIEQKRFRASLTIEQKKMILQYLNKSELFESFLHMKYVGQKRFSLEGGETLIPILASMIDIGASSGVLEFILGMAHRGRLNVLSNILDKSYETIFSEFEEGYIPVSVEGSGDVKYHKGFYSEIKSIHGHPVKITLTPNPSHLEAVGPVVEGQARAKQDRLDFDEGQNKIIPVIIHGDAALSGQGIIYETLQFHRLRGYQTGGTIHLVINNQIGFTTVPKDSRSTHYCTDIAHAFGAPVFHVNGEDPEGCIYAANLAVEMRQKFHCDVFIELVCYRKYGHNESDEPAFTQPIEYQQIRKKRPIRELYRDQLIHQGLLEKEVADSLENEFKNNLQIALQQAKKAPEGKPKEERGALSPAKAKASEKSHGKISSLKTGVAKEVLKKIGERICTIPEELTVHPKLVSLTEDRLAMVNEEGGKVVDWGMAELLAYGSLLWEGFAVRLSGQDCCRGTFSHRHALLMDQVKEQGYIPLQHLKSGQGQFYIYNSPLSEYAVLGFEFGYSIGNPECLVIWEAQFGDFANGAQVIIDQFISTAEQKWNQKFSLTLLLPHGYEGQGPEHSSARIERFLTLAGDNNMQIVQPTTPVQLFHLLRRQMMGNQKKPLIVFTPKGLLRHPSCVSSISEFTEGAFQDVLDDPMAPENPKKLVLCSGRIFYDLIDGRKRSGTDSIAIIRVEQLYPINIEMLKSTIEKYAGFQECFWVQDEPSNMGAWNFMRTILRDLMPDSLEPMYIGRLRSASPAAGSPAVHKKEHAAILEALFGKAKARPEK